MFPVHDQLVKVEVCIKTKEYTDHYAQIMKGHVQQQQLSAFKRSSANAFLV